MPELTLQVDFVTWLIEEARAFEFEQIVAADEDDEDAAAAAPAGDLRSQLAGAIDGLSLLEQADLVALAWTGRALDEGRDPEPFVELVALAAAERVNATSDYLLGMPLIADYLEEGLRWLETLPSDEDEAEV